LSILKIVLNFGESLNQNNPQTSIDNGRE